MSYDLFLTPRLPLDPGEVRAWLARRPHTRVAGTQAVYENADTGVYFTHDLGDDGSVSFNLNFYRPSVFVQEAAPEVAALLEALDFDIEDPQTEGMGEGPFTVEGLVRGWTHGNRFAHRVMVGSRGQRPPTLAAARHEALWRWNLSREAYGDLLASIEMLPVYVPRVFLVVEVDGDGNPAHQVHTAVIWGEAMPMAVPEVDLVLAMDEPGDPPRVIRRADLAEVLAPWAYRAAGYRFELDGREHDVALPHWLLAHDEPPPRDVAAAHRSGVVRQVQILRTDQVLDHERYEEAISG